MKKKIIATIILLILLMQVSLNTCISFATNEDLVNEMQNQNVIENTTKNETKDENKNENKIQNEINNTQSNSQKNSNTLTNEDNNSINSGKTQNTEEKNEEEDTGLDTKLDVEVSDQYVTEDDLLYSNKYLVKDKIVSRVDPKTTMEEFRKNVKIADGKTIDLYEKDGITKSNNNVLGTKKVIKGDNGQEYIISVKGDITGEGEANQVELTMMIRHIIELTGWNLKDVDALSADITGDGKINLVDLNKMVKHIVYGNWEYDDRTTPNPPTIEVIGTKSEEKDLYTSGVKIKIKEDKSTENLKTTYKISGSIEKNESSIEENQVIDIQEDGEYIITAYTYGIQGNRSKASNRKIQIQKTQIPKEYNINYETNGGKLDQDSPTKYIYGNEKELKGATKEGYTFEGWYKEAEFTNKIDKIEKTQIGDITLHAKWKANEYRITYELDGGINNEENPNIYTTGTELTFKQATKKGYIFEGWYKETEFTNKIEKIEKTQTGDITLYAKWEKGEYKITYELNGGENNKENPGAYELGMEIIFKDATRSGYTFEGWYKEAEFTNKIEKIEKTQTGNITVYAKWKANEYMITYELDGGINNKENPNSYITGTEVIFKEPTRQAYIFEGWYKEAEFTNKIEKIEKTQIGDITLYAKWKIKKYTVTLHHYEVEKNEKLADDEVYEFNATDNYTVTSLMAILDEEGNITQTDDRKYLNPKKYEINHIEGNEKGSYENKDNIDINYYYALKEFKITGEAKEGGKVENAEETVKYGNNSTNIIIITPNEGKIVESITINGQEITSYEEDKETFIVTLPILENITEDKNIVVKFKDLIMVAEIVSAPSGYEHLIGTQYTTINKAITIAPSSSTIKVINDTLNEPTITVNKIVTLDLDGKSVQGNNVLIKVQEQSINIINSSLEQANLTSTENESINIAENATLTLGIDDTNINTESIIIEGKNNGIITRGTLNFYDGQIKGEVAIDGVVSDTPLLNNAIVTNDQDKQKATLTVMTDAEAVIGKKPFTQLEKAVEYANTQIGEDGSQVKITVVKDITRSNMIDIPEEKNILLDLNGYTINSTNEYQVFYNDGILEITDSSIQKTGVITGIGKRNILNNNKLKLSDGTIKGTNTGISNNYNKSTFEMTGGTINIINGTQYDNYYGIYNNYGTAKINGGMINVKGTTTQSYFGYGIYNTENANLEVNGGTICGSRNCIDNRGKLLITDGYIYSENSGGSPLLNYGNIKMTGGTIKGKDIESIQNGYSGTLEINAGETYGIRNEGNTIINGGTLRASTTSYNKYSIENPYRSNGTFEINGGEFLATVKNEYIGKITGGTFRADIAIYTGFYNESATLEMTGGTININSINSCGISNSGIANISGISIDITGYSANSSDYTISGAGINNGQTGTMNISDITINVKETRYSNIYGADARGISNGGILNIIKNVNINAISTNNYTPSTQKSYGISNSGTLQLGEKDGQINNDSIQITANQYGVYGESGQFKFYDGTINGITAIYGSIYDMEDGCQIQTTLENSTQTSTLVKGIKVARIGENEYLTLQEAINSCKDGEKTTIQLIYDNIYILTGETVKISKEKDIVLDLNGKNIYSQAKLENEGTFEITDTIAEGKYNTDILNNGTLKLNKGIIYKENYEGKLIENNGTLEVSGAQIKNKSPIISVEGYAIYNNGIVNFIDGILNGYSSSKQYGIYNNENAITNVSGGTINGSRYGIYNNSGTVKIDGGTINASSQNIGTYANSIFNKKGNLEINGGIIESEQSIYNDNGKLTINAGTIKVANASNENTYGIYNINSGIIQMNGGNIKATSYISNTTYIMYGIYNSNNATFKMSNGEISLIARSYGLYNVKTGTVEITNGTISVPGPTKTSGTGKGYGLYNTGMLTVGTKGGEVSKTQPTLTGYEYGVKNTGTFKFYDGIIKGKTESINGTISEIEENTELIKNTNEAGLIQSYLDILPLAKIGEENYYTLEDAISAVQENNTDAVTIKLLRNVNYLSTATSKIVEKRNIILDLNGYTISTEIKDIIINKGTLKLIDESTTKTGTIKNTVQGSSSNYFNLIRNEGNLETINTNITGLLYTNGIYSISGSTTNITNTNIGKINNNGTMIINGGTIANIENYNMLTINDISGKYILNQTGATLNILGGNIVNENQNAIKNYGNLNISGGEIFSKSTSTYYQGNGIYNEETGVVNITGGKITNIYNLNNIELISGNCQIVKNSGTFNAIGGTLYEITNYGTFNLGEKDGNVNIQSPVVTSAIYSYNKGKLNFYDGNITGSCHETNSAIHGSIGNIEDGYSIIKQKINDYNEKLYLSKETEVSIENQNYETLQDAIDSILTTSEVTIKLNRDITYIEAEQTKTIENKNIILDLNGHRIITQTSPFIINKATLKITDNSQEKTGQIESKVKDGNECIIQNEGNLEISNTNLTFMNSNSNYSNAINNKSILIIKDGTRIEYGEVAIYNEKTGTVNMQGGTINSSIGIKNYGAFAMTGGEILRDNNKGIDNYATVLLQKGTVSGYTAIKNNSGKLQIQNEAIITTNCYAIDNYATVLMEQGKIAGEITNYSGTFSMLNGQIESFIENKEGATINIKGGNVSSTRNSTINNEGNLYIEAGNVINATGIAIQNYKTVVLGNNNSTVSAISPVIDAKTYGIYNYDNATISFYDGIIKGETQHVFGAINSKPNNYEIVYSQANTVATLRLIGKTTKIASIGSTYFESVKLAVDSANSGDIIMLQSEDEIVNTITIPENLNITIDLQGFTIVGIGNNTAIENNGTLKIINSTTIKSKIQNTFETAIQNNGTLVIGINDGTIQDNIDIIGKDAAIENNGQLELYDGKLIGKQAITQNIGIIIPEGKQTYITISDGKNILAIKE